MSKEEEKVFEEESSETESSSGSESSITDIEEVETDSRQSYSEKGAESEEEDDKEDNKSKAANSSTTAPQDAQSTLDPPPSESTDSSSSSNPQKKAIKKPMTRLQEGDILLSIYDALAAYRRPSQKPSLARKLESIDSAISLLTNLRLQLTLGDDGLLSSSTSSSSSVAATSSVQNTSSDSQSKNTTPKNPKSSIKPGKSKTKEPKEPKSVLEYYIAENQDGLISKDSKLTMAAVKTQLKTQWKSLKATEVEIWNSKFSVRISAPKDIEKAPEFVKTKSEDLKNAKGTDLTSKSKDEGHKCEISEKSLIPVSATTIDLGKPPTDSFVWKCSLNNSLSGKEFATRAFSALRSIFCKISVKLNSSGSRWISVSEDCRKMAVIDTHGSLVYNLNFGDAKGADVATRESIFEISETIDALHYSCMLCPSGKYLFTLNQDHYFRKWDLESRELLAESKIGGNGNLNFSISSDGKAIAICSSEGYIWIFNSIDLNLLVQIASGGEKRAKLSNKFLSIAMSPNGELVASGTLDGTIRVWNIGTSELIACYNDGEDTISAISFLNEKSLLTASTKGLVRYFHIDDAQRDCVICNVGFILRSIAIDAHNGIIFVGGKDSNIRVYVLPSPDSIPYEGMNKPIAILIGHSSIICKLTVTRKSENTFLLASMSGDGCYSLWTYGE